jgi:hypothetical protein
MAYDPIMALFITETGHLLLILLLHWKIPQSQSLGRCKKRQAVHMSSVPMKIHAIASIVVIDPYVIKLSGYN